MKVISATWKDGMITLMNNGTKIDETLTFNPCVAWLVLRLTERGTPYKIYNLGAGVKRITTDTDTCPCCKRKL